jgi:hypothetical protein
MDLSLQIKDLYLKEVSGPEISSRLSIPVRQVYRVLEKLKVPRRGLALQHEIRFSKSPLSFKFKEKLSLKDKELLVAGLMLYYGEGAKTKNTVDFANSDPRIVRIFLKFLRQICGVEEDRLRFYLYCFSDQNPQELIEFWSRDLKASKASFTKPYVREVYRNLHRRMPYGVLHVRYSDLRLLKRILDLSLKMSENLLK